MDNIELKPCPICGDDAKITVRSGDGKNEHIETVSCRTCHLSVNRFYGKGMPFETEIDVIKTWNMRS